MAASALETSLSPYLRLHKDNPVAWRSWSPAVLAEAEAAGKPIFLSIGYTGCHWCHMMNAESFSDPAIAATINENFIPVLVDREERPDIDQFYQSALPALSISGGWPLNLFLTPEGVPFFVSQYAPKEERLGTPAFRSVLGDAIALWSENNSQAVEQAGMLRQSLEALYNSDLSAGPETVQLDPRRNPYADKARVEAELARTIGATHPIWLPRGLTRDYDEFGTNGHVDIVATIPSPGRLLLHTQRNPEHPDFEVSRELRAFLSGTTDAAGRAWDIVELPAPETLRDEEGFVDWSYVNHLVVNGGIVACGFGEERADAEATEILEAAYPGRRVTMVDSRPIFARGGGIHCITQQQPAVTA